MAIRLTLCEIFTIPIVCIIFAGRYGSSILFTLLFVDLEKIHILMRETWTQKLPVGEVKSGTMSIVAKILMMENGTFDHLHHAHLHCLIINCYNNLLDK